MRILQRDALIAEAYAAYAFALARRKQAENKPLLAHKNLQADGRVDVPEQRNTHAYMRGKDGK